MSTVAEQLRAAREARSLSVEQVADITKMRTDHVRALEDGDYSAFSAPVYIRGFVRTYSRLLKLDETPLLASLDEEMGKAGHFDDGASAGPSKGILDFATLQLSKLDWRKSLIGTVAAVLLVALTLGFLAWRTARTSDPLQGLEPGVYKPQSETTEMLPLGR